MADKTLRIIFSGISTLWPGPPRGEDKAPDKAFVIMAANAVKDRDGKKIKHVNEWGATIPDHSPFVHVARSLLVDPPWPSETVIVGKGGECFIYFFEDARIVIQPKPKEPKEGPRIKYFIDPEARPLADRPGSDDVAPADDIRWLADIRDILSKPAPLKATANPAAASVGPEVAAVVNLDGGTLRANFPGDTVYPRPFMDKKGNVVPDFQRALADEFIIDISYPKETEQVTLLFQELREGTLAGGPPNLVLKWPDGETTLELRMGNDPKDEVRRLGTTDRFDPVRQIGPVLKPRDDDFDLHYNLLKIPDKVGRPLPQNDIHQCDFPGCKPGTT